jgi:hypothetical protein
MTGSVADGSGSASLVVNVDTSAFQPYAQFDLPDVRTLAPGAVVSVPASGSVAVDGGWCNFASSATFTIRDAAGGAAPAPAFVTGDFVRAGDLVLETAPDKPVSGPDGKAPDCGATITVHASLRFTADSYAAATDNGSCVGLGK